MAAAAPVPFGGLLGVAPCGVPAFSCGSVKKPQATRERAYSVDGAIATGEKWTALEFARRWLAMAKGALLPDVPTPANLWEVERAPFLGVGGGKVPLNPGHNGNAPFPPDAGDLLVWQQCERYPVGHVAVVTAVSAADGTVRIAEQGTGPASWDGRDYSRELTLQKCNGRYIVADDTAASDGSNDILGWVTASYPFLDPSRSDIADRFRAPIGDGSMTRTAIDRDLAVPWIDKKTPTGFFLRRSLVPDGAAEANHPEEVPSGYYTIDYDMWQRLRVAATDLHQLFVSATRQVINAPDADDMLSNTFGIPRELHGLLRASLAYPCFLGRFDFGYDGSRIETLEYNCDSSAALLETAETQAQVARHYGFDTVGSSSGAQIAELMAEYWENLADSPLCPPTKTVHFLVDDDDEERYTALTVMRAAEAAGFRCKLCVKLVDFKFADGAAPAGDMQQPDGSTSGSVPRTGGGGAATQGGKAPRIVDLDGVAVLLVWKTWSWSTVIADFERKRDAPAGQSVTPQPGTPRTPRSVASDSEVAPSPAKPKPTLSDVLLCPHTVVLEPLWKAVAGSKALLPIVYERMPQHPNLLPAYFTLHETLEAKGAFVRKPVRGRGGMNVTVIDNSMTTETTPTETTTGGKFADDVVVYQDKCSLKKFDGYYPIFGAWVVGAKFGGAAVREDHSRVTSLASCVAPLRVVRK